MLFLGGCDDEKTPQIELPEGMRLADSSLDLDKLELGTEVEFIITPGPGKMVDQLLVNGVDKTATIIDNKVKIKIVEGLTISLTFRNKSSGSGSYTVTLGSGLSSTDQLTGLSENSKVNITINVPEGQEVDQFRIDGFLIDLKGALTYQLLVTKNHNVTVTFKDIEGEPKYTVTLGEGLDADHELTRLPYGTSFLIYIIEPENQEVNQFKVDGIVIDLEGKLYYRITVTQNHIVTVTFKDKVADPTYTVTWKNYNGEVLKVDENVAHGEMPFYTGATPTKPGGYTFIGWTPEPSAVIKDIEYTAVFLGGETASEDFTFYDLGDGYAIYKYHGTDSNVNIPAAYQEKPVILIDDRAFQYNETITSLVVPDSVEVIEESAFYECTNLKTVILGSGVKRIGDNAFSGCKKLSSINLPEGLTHIGEYSFSRCGQLQTLSLPNSLESLGYSALSSSYSMTYTTYENGTYLGNTTNPHLVFIKRVDSSLEEIIIHDNCKVIGDRAFYSASSLKTINFGEGVKYIGKRSFSNCSKLGAIVIPKTIIKIDDYAFAGSSITYLGFGEHSLIKHIGSHAFSGCENLTNVFLSDTIEYIGEEVFKGSDSINKTEYSNVYYLGSADNPHFLLLKNKWNLETSYTIHPDTRMISHDAFNNCTKMTSITIPKGVKYIGPRAFMSCHKLVNFSVESGNEKYYAPNNTVIMEIGTGTLVSAINDLIFPAGVYHIGDYALASLVTETITIPDTVVSIGEYALFSTSAKTINVPNSVKRIGEGAFHRCMNITSINIPSGLKYIPQAAFRECTALKTINIPNSVSYIGREAFIDCGSAESLTFGTGTIIISISAFDGCRTLEAITIPNSVEAIEYRAFAECKGVTTISIGKGAKIIEEMAFLSCNAATNLTVHLDNQTYDSREDCNGIIETKTNTLIYGIKTTTIPDSVTTIGNSAFYRCIGIDNIVMESGVTKIEGYAFYSSTLKSITLENQLTYIGDYAFQYCAGLTSIVIPASVTHMGYHAFQYCTNVKIYCKATTQPYDWAPNWNSSNRPFYWYSEEANYDGSHWRYVDGVPTVWAL